MERYDLPPPAGWDDFEDLCRDLWALLWEDPDTRRHGRREREVTWLERRLRGEAPTVDLPSPAKIDQSSKG